MHTGKKRSASTTRLIIVLVGETITGKRRMFSEGKGKGLLTLLIKLYNEIRRGGLSLYAII